MQIFVNYPENIYENPFTSNIKGGFFVYLPYRKTCLSYLSHNFSDFDYENSAMCRAIPMGHTSLWVLERCFVANSDGFKKIFKRTENIETLFCKEELNGQYKLISQAELFDIPYRNVGNKIETIDEWIYHTCEAARNAKEKMQCKNIFAIGAKKLKEYNWH